MQERLVCREVGLALVHLLHIVKPCLALRAYRHELYPLGVLTLVEFKLYLARAALLPEVNQEVTVLEGETLRARL